MNIFEKKKLLLSGPILKNNKENFNKYDFILLTNNLFELKKSYLLNSNNSFKIIRILNENYINESFDSIMENDNNVDYYLVSKNSNNLLLHKCNISELKILNFNKNNIHLIPNTLQFISNFNFLKLKIIGCTFYLENYNDGDKDSTLIENFNYLIEFLSKYQDKVKISSSLINIIKENPKLIKIPNKTKLFIHIGLSKTATTSFQDLLQNEENLKVFKDNNINIIPCHWKNLENPYYPLNLIEKNKINILSHENYIAPFFNTTFYNDNNYRVNNNNYKKIYHTIENYKKNINFDFDVKIVCVLREQCSYIESVYLQQVKTLIVRDKFEVLKNKLNYKDFYYSKFINELKELFDVEYLWYEDIYKNKDEDIVFKDLFFKLGLGNIFDIIPVKKSIKNISLKTESIEFIQNNLKKDFTKAELISKAKNNFKSTKINYYKNLYKEEEIKDLQKKFFEDNKSLGFPQDFDYLIKN